VLLIAAMLRALPRLLFLLLVAAQAAVAAPADRPAPSAATVEPRVWRDTAAGQRASVLILLRQQADLRAAATGDPQRRGWAVYRALHDLAAQTQPALLALLHQAGAAPQPLWVANAIVASCDRALVERLAADPAVRALESNLEQRWIEPDSIAAATVTPVVRTAALIEWGVQSVGAPAVWARGSFGQGIVVANQDTGMQWDHPALKSRYRGFTGGSVSHDYNWHDAIHSASGNPCGSDSPAPCDDQGHGTHTTGTIVGDDGAGNQIGVAPAARWIGCRNMDRGNGTPARYAECFQFFIAPTDSSGKNPDPDRRPHVVNNSWGCPRSEGCAPTTLQLIVENTQAAGILVEASAGNSGPSCASVDSGPASLAAALSTAAYDSSGRLAGFSSRGPVTIDGSGRPKPDLAAPGVRVRSSLPGGRYGNLSGTSMAGPHVVGVVALLWSARPELVRQVDDTKALLLASANPSLATSFVELCGGISSDFIPNLSFGAGRVDALAAVTW
jgi:subtilisin family serine protease